MNLTEQNRLRKLAGMGLVEETTMKLEDLKESRQTTINDQNQLANALRSITLMFEDEGESVVHLTDVPTDTDLFDLYSKSFKEFELDVLGEVPHFAVRVEADDTSLINFPINAIARTWAEQIEVDKTFLTDTFGEADLDEFDGDDRAVVADYQQRYRQQNRY